MVRCKRMEEMAISEFKAKCLAVIERVRRTRKPVLVTRFGKPVAEVVPTSPPARPEDWMGSMRSSGHIVGDIVSPESHSTPPTDSSPPQHVCSI
ncbi:MAG: type II toxin-antitoxin system Phd/YefM family antitoxin [Candidatus Binatia bacterium]